MSDSMCVIFTVFKALMQCHSCDLFINHDNVYLGLGIIFSMLLIRDDQQLDADLVRATDHS